MKTILTKDHLIVMLSYFAPKIKGICPKCGEVVFEGYKCPGCGLDSSYHKLKPFNLNELE